MCLVYIEISCEDSRQIGSEFFHLLLYEEGTFHPRFFSDVIHMQIEEKEFESGIFAFEVSPATNTGQYRIPSDTCRIGCFRKPEISFFNKIEFIRTIEYSRMFSCFFAVITPYADIFISR